MGSLLENKIKWIEIDLIAHHRQKPQPLLLLLFFLWRKRNFSTLTKFPCYEAVTLARPLTWHRRLSHGDGFWLGAGLTDAVHVNSTHTELVLSITEQLLHVEGGAVTGSEITPCVVQRVPDLQIVRLDNTASIIRRSIPGEGERGPADVWCSRDASWWIRLVYHTEILNKRDDRSISCQTSCVISSR